MLKFTPQSKYPTDLERKAAKLLEDSSEEEEQLSGSSEDDIPAPHNLSTRQMGLGPAGSRAFNTVSITPSAQQSFMKGSTNVSWMQRDRSAGRNTQFSLKSPSKSILKSSGRNSYKIQSPEISKLKSQMETRMLQKEVDILGEELHKKQERLEEISSKLKKKKKVLKKTKSEMKMEVNKVNEERYEYEMNFNKMKENEENLVKDLLQQQQIARDAVVALDKAKERFELEKEEIEKRWRLREEIAIQKVTENYEHKCHAIQKINQELKDQLRLNEKDLDKARQEILSMNANEDIAREQMQEIRSLKEDLKEVERANAMIEKELSEVRYKKDHVEVTLESKLREMTKDLDNSNANYKKEIERLTIEIGLKKDELVMMKNEMEINENNFKSEIDYLNEKESSLKIQVDSLEKELSSAKKDVRNLKKIESHYHDVRSELATMEEEYDSLKHKFKMKLTKKEKARETQKQEWNSIYNELAKEITHLKTEIDYLEEDNRMLRKRLNERSSPRSHYETTRRQVQSQIAPGGNESLIDSLQEKDEEIGILWNIIKDVNHKKRDVSESELKNLVDLKLLEQRAKRTLKV